MRKTSMAGHHVSNDEHIYVLAESADHRVAPAVVEPDDRYRSGGGDRC